MKKFLFILLIALSLLSLPNYNNDYIDITHMINVSSLGIDYQYNSYTIYAYVINNYTMSKSDYNTSSNSTPSTIISSTSDTIENTFFKLFDSVFVKLNFSHMETLVIKKDFISSKNISLLIDYFSSHNEFYPKFNIFITNEEIKDIYNINYFTDTSSYYNILTEYKSEIEHHQTTFIDLINDFNESNYFMIYPSIKLNTNINNKTLSIDGYYYITNGIVNKISFLDNSLLYLLYSTNDISFQIDSKYYFLYSFSLKTYIINNKLYLLFYSKSNYPDSLKKIIYENIVNLYHQNIDIYNLKYFNIKLDDVKIISIEKSL